jgi:hypothetical protein
MIAFGSLAIEKVEQARLAELAAYTRNKLQWQGILYP